MLSVRRIMTVAAMSALLSIAAIVPAMAAHAPDPDDITDGLLERPVSTLVGSPLGLPLGI
ncbi:hypothetical protein [Streptomyces sp. NPDC047028]|uniref:hypothetical protein n=1 Tax=Streptomyces sp. NPDC047028 TaxID=3155793 RepID=UPI0033CAA86A